MFPRQEAPATYRELGNGVSVGVVWNILKRHVDRDKDVLRRTAPRLPQSVTDLPPSRDELLLARDPSGR